MLHGAWMCAVVLIGAGLCDMVQRECEMMVQSGAAGATFLCSWSANRATAWRFDRKRRYTWRSIERISTY